MAGLTLCSDSVDESLSLLSLFSDVHEYRRRRHRSPALLSSPSSSSRNLGFPSIAADLPSLAFPSSNPPPPPARPPPAVPRLLRASNPSAERAGEDPFEPYPSSHGEDPTRPHGQAEAGEEGPRLLHHQRHQQSGPRCVFFLLFCGAVVLASCFGGCWVLAFFSLPRARARGWVRVRI